MTKDQKIIKGKVGLLELAKQLGNVTQACKYLAIAATASTALRSSMTYVDGPGWTSGFLTLRTVGAAAVICPAFWRGAQVRWP